MTSFPALTAFLAVEGARRGKWGRAWAWAVLGGLLKLFPFLLLPGFLIVERRRTGKWPLKRLWVAIVPLAGCHGGRVSRHRSAAALSRRCGTRCAVGSSSPACPGASASKATLPRALGRGFGSVEIAGGGHCRLVRVHHGAYGRGNAPIWLLGWRDRLSLEAVSLSILTIAVLTDKAFAPQYPHLADTVLGLLAASQAQWVAAAALTSLVYPFLYTEAHIWGPVFIWPRQLERAQCCVARDGRWAGS